MSMDFLTKHTIFVVVSLSDMISGTFPVSKVEGYYAWENAAQEEADRLSTWKTTSVVKYDVTINNLIGLLNASLKDGNA